MGLCGSRSLILSFLHFDLVPKMHRISPPLTSFIFSLPFFLLLHPPPPSPSLCTSSYSSSALSSPHAYFPVRLPLTAGAFFLVEPGFFLHHRRQQASSSGVRVVGGVDLPSFVRFFASGVVRRADAVRPAAPPLLALPPTPPALPRRQVRTTVSPWRSSYNYFKSLTLS